MRLLKCRVGLGIVGAEFKISWFWHAINVVFAFVDRNVFGWPGLVETMRDVCCSTRLFHFYVILYDDVDVHHCRHSSFIVMDRWACRFICNLPSVNAVVVTICS